jgi:hypothetical protein
MLGAFAWRLRTFPAESQSRSETSPAMGFEQQAFALIKVVRKALLGDNSPVL